MKILIAEDDRLCRRVLEYELKRWGYDVISAEDGAEALHVMQSDYAPDVAILDWIMPKMDGTEVCRQVGTMPKSTPPYLIFLTIKAAKEDIEEGLKSGADDYLTKPVRSEELRNRLDSAQRALLWQKNTAPS